MNYDNDDDDDDGNAEMMAKMTTREMDGTVMKSKILCSGPILCVRRMSVFGIDFNITVTLARHWWRWFSFEVFNTAPTKETYPHQECDSLFKALNIGPA